MSRVLGRKRNRSESPRCEVYVVWKPCGIDVVPCSTLNCPVCMELHRYICSARWRHVVPLANVMPGLALPKPRLASFQSAWLSFSMPARKVASLKSLKLIVSNGPCQKTIENMSCCWSEMTNTLVSSFKSTLLCCIIKCIHCILYTTLFFKMSKTLTRGAPFKRSTRSDDGKFFVSSLRQ